MNHFSSESSKFQTLLGKPPRPNEWHNTNHRIHTSNTSNFTCWCKICSSTWIISPGIGVHIQNVWKHHLVYLRESSLAVESLLFPEIELQLVTTSLVCRIDILKTKTQEVSDFIWFGYFEISRFFLWENLLVSPNPLVLLPSRELTYPINGKDNSSSQPPLDGTWFFLGRLFNIYCFVLSKIILLRFWHPGHLHRWKQHLSCSEGAMVSMNRVSNAWRRMHVVCKTSKFSLLHFSMPQSSE